MSCNRDTPLNWKSLIKKLKSVSSIRCLDVIFALFPQCLDRTWYIGQLYDSLDYFVTILIMPLIFKSFPFFSMVI